MSFPRFLRFLLIVTFSIPLAACTVSLGQLNEFRKGIPLVTEGNTGQSENDVWTLRFADAELQLIANYQSDGSITFSNDAGLLITFDGNEITEVRGFPGALGRYQVTKVGLDQQVYRSGGRSFEARCSAPKQWRLSSERVGTRIQCRGSMNGVDVTTQHSVEKDARGDVRLIAAQIAPSAPPIVLRRSRP